MILSVLARHFYTVPMAEVPTTEKDTTLLEEGSQEGELEESVEDVVVVNNNQVNVAELKQREAES